MSVHAVRGTRRARLAATSACVIALASAFAVPAAHAAPGGVYNIRSGPGLNYPVIGQMVDPDCSVEVATDGSTSVKADGYMWNKVDTGSVIGWSINDEWCI